MEQNIPNLLYIICAMSAMAFLVSSCIWLWQVWTGRIEGSVDLRGFLRAIAKGQGQAFIFVMIISIFVGLYDFVKVSKPLEISAEMVVIICYVLFVYFLSGREESAITTIRIFLKMLAFGALCIAGWTASIAVGFALYYSIIYQSFVFVDTVGAQVLSIFVAGLLWNVPIISLYMLVKRKEAYKDGIDGKKLYHYLWPVMAAYMVLFLPLMVQEIAHSPEWHKMKMEKPVRIA